MNLIKFLNYKCPNLEWSGILVYKTTGQLYDNSLQIEVIDLIPKNVGTGAYTEFEIGSSFEDVYNKYEDIWPVYMGLIHHHNIMGVSPSGTDTKNMEDSAPHYPFYLSIIVNNKLDWNVRICSEYIVDKTTFKDHNGNLIEVNITPTKGLLMYEGSIAGTELVIEEGWEEMFTNLSRYETPVAKTYTNFNHQPSIPFSSRGATTKSIISPVELFTLGFKKGNGFKDVIHKVNIGEIDKYLNQVLEYGMDMPNNKFIDAIESFRSYLKSQKAPVAQKLYEELADYFIIEEEVVEEVKPLKQKSIHDMSEKEFENFWLGKDNE